MEVKMDIHRYIGANHSSISHICVTDVVPRSALLEYLAITSFFTLGYTDNTFLKNRRGLPPSPVHYCCFRSLLCLDVYATVPLLKPIRDGYTHVTMTRKNGLASVQMWISKEEYDNLSFALISVTITIIKDILIVSYSFWENCFGLEQYKLKDKINGLVYDKKLDSIVFFIFF